jgi:translation initiation factor IF-3
MFRGREMQHPELGRKILDHVAEEVSEVGRVEVFPKQDGRNMIMVMAPDTKAQAAADKKRAAVEDNGSAPAGPEATDQPDATPTAPDAAPAPAEAIPAPADPTVDTGA